MAVERENDVDVAVDGDIGICEFCLIGERSAGLGKGGGAEGRSGEGEKERRGEEIAIEGLHEKVPWVRGKGEFERKPRFGD